jgi:hypothetical protein
VTRLEAVTPLFSFCVSDVFLALVRDSDQVVSSTPDFVCAVRVSNAMIQPNRSRRDFPAAMALFASRSRLT